MAAATLGAVDQDAPIRPIEAGSWLIFSDGDTTTDTPRRCSNSIPRRACSSSRALTSHDLGPDSYGLDPAQPQHFRRLLEEAFGATRPPCRGVVHLWSLMAAAPAETSTESLESARALGTTSVLHLVQALTLSGSRTHRVSGW